MSQPSSSVPLCFQCGSPLIFVSRTVDTTNSKFPTTSTIYRCSNQECQDEKDRQEASRVKHKKEQETAKLERKTQQDEKKKDAKAQQLASSS